METINMQYKSISQIDTNLTEIHAEMSELLDKQVYVLNEYFK